MVGDPAHRERSIRDSAVDRIASGRHGAAQTLAGAKGKEGEIIAWGAELLSFGDSGGILALSGGRVKTGAIGLLFRTVRVKEDRQFRLLGLDDG